MKINTILKYILTVVFLGGIVGGGYYVLLLPQLNRVNQKKLANVKVIVENGPLGWKFPIAKFPITGSDDNLIAYSDIRDPGGIPQGLPISLKIPVIGVNTAIEDAYITSDGRMDVPAGSINVAWFALGPHPGVVGSAVIGGHFGIDNGVPKVFYNLDKLVPGNKVYIIDDNYNSLEFVVRRIQLFDRNADSTTVFTSEDGLAHLNLITCEGVWNQVNNSYPDRRVIFTDYIKTETATAAEPPSVAAIKPIHSSPTVVLSKLTPTITTALTHIPTIPLALSTLAPVVKVDTTGSMKKATPSPLMFVKSAESLYATPIDGLITSLLILSIVFIIYRIIKR